ncbi:ribonuclease BN [Kineobactrum sediminis]|uniref:Ribonuclease BN n=1 Tax=Kineobactrum sediminis TaxID=1905677 RepID=A0A2N5Y1U0_9GAMM|nr:YihY/virulence factor BrkB family protein [Kineobactrum sediminis]PLW82353.1 ribonuclease BN [Kineobactrum sediminis]
MQSPVDIYDSAKQFVLGRLWRADLETLSAPRQYVYQLLRFLFVMAREISTGQLTLRAMSLVYTTLLSMVPLLAVSFSVLKAFGVHNQVEPLLFNLVQPLGEQGNEIVDKVLGFVENMKVGVLGSVGLVLLLYTVISLIQKVELSFNYVWHTKSARPLSRRFSDYLSVIMVGPVLVFSALGLTASMMNSEVIQAVMGIEPFGSLLVFLSKLIPWVLIVLAFTFVYIFVPNTRVKFSSALVGALVGGALWQGTGLLFAEFASSSTKYAAIYSGFAILIMFMIWLYLSWLILLLGAQVAFFHQHPERICLTDKRTPLNGRFREQLALLVMYRVAYRFIHDEGPLSLDDLADVLHIPVDRTAEVVQLLLDRHLLLETNSEPAMYALATDPAGLELADLLQLIRSPGNEQAVLESQILAGAPVDAVLEQMERGGREQLGGQTLRDLAAG